jgi:hypothetical protein
MAERAVSFDKKNWQKAIKQPDWYIEYGLFTKSVKKTYGPKSDEAKKLSKQIRRFFEKALERNEVFLAVSGEDWDRERAKIDSIVIHHTSSKPGYRLGFLNSVHLLNIYVPVYSKANGRPPVWSGHFYEGQQVFWGYHWLMRMDGSFERLLEDNQIGWHAGNWEVNRRSIAICLDNDYEQRNPRKKVLQDLAVFIKQNYPNIKAENIIGHKEARAGTICPGKNFVNVWKPELLEYLSDGS